MQASRVRERAKCLLLAFLLGCGVYLVRANMSLVWDRGAARIQQRALPLHRHGAEFQATPNESVYARQHDAMQHTLASSPASAHCTLLRVQADGASHIVKGSGVPHTMYLARLQALLPQAVRYKKRNFSAAFFIFIDTADTSSCKASKAYTHPSSSLAGPHAMPRVFPFAITGNAYQPLAFQSFPLPLDRYHRNMQQILARIDPVPYEQKQAKAIWHGQKSGYLAWSRALVPAMTRTPRDEIVRLALAHPQLLEASYTKVPFERFLQFQYIVAVSGNSWSSVLAEALWTNSVVLRQDPHMYSWYESMLVAWRHYIPVRHDLGDLIRKIEWAQRHPAECKAMSRAARQFARQFFNTEAQLAYTYSTIMRSMPRLLQGFENASV